MLDEGLEAGNTCCVADNGLFAERLANERRLAATEHDDNDEYGFHCTRTDINKNYRYSLYCHFISEFALTDGIGRVELPLCYVNAVREIWPSCDGRYKGFIFKG